MNERMKEIRKSLELTLEKFGERVGVSRAAISNIETGNRNLTEQMIKSICREFNVNETWLRTGEGDMFLALTRQEEIASLTKTLLSEESDSFKNRLISVLANMSVEQWEVLAEIAEGLAKAKKED